MPDERPVEYRSAGSELRQAADLLERAAKLRRGSLVHRIGIARGQHQLHRVDLGDREVADIGLEREQREGLGAPGDRAGDRHAGRPRQEVAQMVAQVALGGIEQAVEPQPGLRAVHRG